MKPEFFQDETLAACTPHARLLAVALLQLCDRQGVFLNIPMQVHAHAFPWEPEVKVQSLLGELEGVGYLTFYRVGGKAYGFIPGFVRHQNIGGKEAQSPGRYPLPDQADASGEVEGKLPGSDKELPREVKGNAGKGKGTRKELLGDKSPDEFLEFKSVYPKRDGDQKWRDAEKACKARIREGHSWAEIIEGAKRYDAWCKSTDKAGTGFVKQAATFVGPGKPFLEPWSSPTPTSYVPKVLDGDSI